MKGNFKRSLSLVLALVLILGMLPSNVLHVHAADDEAATVATDYTEADVGKSFEFKGNSAKPTGTIPTGSHWEGLNGSTTEPVKSADEICGKIAHTHTSVCACAHTHNAVCKYVGCTHSLVQHDLLHGINACAEKCETCGLTENWTPYEHAHDDTCYTYTWTLVWNQYTITWNIGEGAWNDDSTDESKTTTVKHNDVLTAPAVKESFTVNDPVNGEITYTFQGWEGLADGATATGDASYTAKYTTETVYIATLNLDGGQGATELRIEEGETFTAPVNPTKTDYMFVKWVVTDTNDAYDFGSAVTGNISLTAVWALDTNGNNIPDETETVKVIIDANGEVKLTDGNGNVIEATNVTATYDSTSGKVTIVATPASGYYVDVTVNNGAVLTGSWKNTDVDNGLFSTDYRNIYTGSFTVQPGKSYEVTVVNTKQEFSKPVQDLNLEVNGATFDSWLDATQKGDAVEAVVLTALYGENYDSSRYECDFGLVGSGAWGIKLNEQFAVKVVEKGDAKHPDVSANFNVTLTDNRDFAEITHGYVNDSSFNTEEDFKKGFAATVLFNGTAADFEGLTSLGKNGEITWALEENGTYTATVKALSKEGWKETTATFSGLTWVVSQYAIEFKDWDGSVILAAKNYPYGTLVADIDVPADPTRIGYTFTGWDPVVSDVKGTVTYVATYEINTYNVIWVVDGVETKVSYQYGAAVEQIDDPAKTGYTFTGWDVETPATMPADDVTITATWKINQYKVTWQWMSANGVETLTQMLDYNSEISAHTVPVFYEVVEDGEIVRYYFKGWTGLTDGAKVPANDATVYVAEYTKTSVFTVDFNVDGGSSVVSQYIEDSKLATKPAEPTKPGYRFDGWYLNGELYDFTTPVTGDITLTAKWSLYVARLESTGEMFISLQDAVNAAQETDKISLLADINMGQSQINVKGKDDLTIDLNKHKVISNSSAFVVSGGSSTGDGKLTLINGYIEGNNKGGGSVKAAYRGTLILGEDLTVTSLHADTSTSLVGEGTVIINDGAYISNVVIQGSCKATINGGSYVRNVVVRGTSNVIINAGSIIGELIKESDESKLTIYGGYFSQDVTEWVAAGYACVYDTANDDGYPETTYKVENHDTVNNNGVKDEDETITITLSGNGSYTVTGAIKHPLGTVDTVTYVFDSKNNPNVTITVTPVVENGISSSYVASVTGATLTYGEGFVATANLTAKNGDVIEIVLVDVPVIKDSSVVMYNFFTKEIPYGDIYNAVIQTPAYKNGAVTYTFFARPAMTHTVTIDSLDLDSSVKTLLSTVGINDFSFDMDELWLPLDAQIEESVDLETAVSTYLTKERINGLLAIYNAAHDAAYGPAYDKAYQEYVDRLGTTWGADTAAKAAAEVVAVAAGGEAVKDDIQAIYDVVYASAMYYGAHNFGYNATGADTVDEQIRIEFTDEAMHWVAEATVTLKDPRESAFISGSDLTLTYRDYTDEDLLAMFGLVDMNGNPIEGAIYSVQMTDPYTFEGKNVSESVYELTIKFAGNENYKAAEKTFNITIVKATASIDIPNINTTFGDQLPGIDVTLGNQYGDKQEIIDSLVEIIIGLDLADLEITPDGKLEGIGTHIQIMLPKDDTLATIFKTLGLDVYGEEGETLKFDELQGLLEQLNGLLEGFDSGNETVGGITNILESVTGLVDLSNVEITFGGKYPTDMGVYVYGAVSTSGNYETAYDIGYIIIKPDTTKVYLDWNKPIPNNTLNIEGLKNFDLGATAFDDELFETLNADATKLVINLFLGIDLNGKTYLTDKPETLGNGAYVEIAFIYDIGNELYYAVPIVRPIVVMPNIVNVELKDNYGNVTNDMTVDFNNKGQSFDVYVDGVLANDSEYLTVYYVGIQSNGKFYNSTEKPVHAGVYTAIAVYAKYDSENGALTIMNIEDIIGGIIDGVDTQNIDTDRILATLRSDLDGLDALGINTGIITILPVESKVEVSDKIEIVGGEHKPQDQVTAGSAAGVNPDTTVIIGSIGTNGTYSENGLSALVGNVNVDFPRWMDELIAQYAPGVNDGISASDFADKLVNKLPDITAKLTELGATSEMLSALNNAINNVYAALTEVPENVTVSFKDDYTVSNVGAYLIMAVVTDSDHYPSVDVGYLVIVPEVSEVVLKWNYEDENGIYTRDLLELVDLLASAYNKQSGELDSTATGKITYQYIGVNGKGEAVIYTNVDKDALPNGAYIEIAYIALELDGQMVISDLIARPIVVVPSSCNVVVDELRTEFDNTAKVPNITITDLYGNVIDVTKGQLIITYAGMQTNGQPYLSDKAPVHAGIYEVIAVYMEYDENGEMRYCGAGGSGILVDLTDSSIDVSGGEYDCGEDANVIVNTNGGNVRPDFILISGAISYNGNVNEMGLDDLTGDVNIDLPRWLDAYLAENAFFQDGIDKDYLIRFVNSYAEKIGQYMEVEDVLDLLNQLPENVAITFEDSIVYTEPGYYFYYGIVADSDHKPSTDTGLVMINHVATEPVEENHFAPGCTTDGGYDLVIYCVCGEELSRETIIEKGTALGHNMVLVRKELGKNCQELGYAWYTCDRPGCDYHENGETVPGTHHEHTRVEIIEANCTQEGSKTTICKDCGEVVSTEVLPVNDDHGIVNCLCRRCGKYFHNEVIDAAKAPTCSETGLTEGSHCSACGEVFVKQEIVPELDHSYNTVVTAPTCTEDGYTTYTCSVCGDSYVADHVDELGHTANAPVKENEKAPSITENGSYDQVVYCTVCGTELSRETIVVPATGALCVNLNTGKIYIDLTDALDAAYGTGATIKMLEDATGEFAELFVIVHSGLTLDLNGHYVEASDLISRGNVIDSEDGIGGLKISNDVKKSTVHLAEDNTYLPLYDATNGCYRFFNYELINMGVITLDTATNKVMYGIALKFTNADAYALLKDTANSGVEIYVALDWSGKSPGMYAKHTISSKTIVSYAEICASGFVSNIAMTVTVSELNSLKTGDYISATASISSETGVISTNEPIEYKIQ